MKEEITKTSNPQVVRRDKEFEYEMMKSYGTNVIPAVLSIYGREAKFLNNWEAFEFLLIKGMKIEPCYDLDIELSHLYESYINNENLHWIAIFIMYEPMRINNKYQIFCNVLKKDFFNGIMVVYYMTNIVINRIMSFQSPIPSYIPEYTFNNYFPGIYY